MADHYWDEARWLKLEHATRRAALAAATDEGAWAVIARHARLVLRAYSTSFFVVTRFLPPAKRTQVEAIYAAVRYPDEIVDTFPLPEGERRRRLDDWSALYEAALAAASVKAALGRGIPCFLAGFAQVVKDRGIPPEHYRAFVAAMRLDAGPRCFSTVDDLIESYVYGSAVVVGYFLTYVYGAGAPGSFPRALESARALGIALQLTNFIRDVAEDQRRGRLYLPLDLLRAEGVGRADVYDPGQRPALGRVLRRMAATAEEHYAAALTGLEAFAPDSRLAIRACIDVYRQLNGRVGQGPGDILRRETVPFREKFRVLPASKYWRLPLAYLGH